MARFKWGDKVQFPDRKTPLRVIGQTKLEGERALQLASNYANANTVARRQWMDTSKLYDQSKGPLGVFITTTVPVANLVKDGRVWRERWRQQSLFNPTEEA